MGTGSFPQSMRCLAREETSTFIVNTMAISLGRGKPQVILRLSCRLSRDTELAVTCNNVGYSLTNVGGMVSHPLQVTNCQH